MENIFYVYVYNHPITGFPMYIGKGKGGRYLTHLTFAKRKGRKSKWLNYLGSLLNQGLNPDIKIILDNLSEQKALDLEHELIVKYGRRDYDENGILFNKTLGYDGLSGFTHSSYTKEKISKTKLGRIASGEIIPHAASDKQKQKLIETNKKRARKIAQFSKEGEFLKEWESAAEIGRQFGCDRGGVLWAAKNKNRLFEGFFWRYSDDEDCTHGKIIEAGEFVKFDKQRRTNNASKSIFQIDLDGNIIKEWISVSEAIRNFPKSHARAFDEAIKMQKIYRDFYWAR